MHTGSTSNHPPDKSRPTTAAPPRSSSGRPGRRPGKPRVRLWLRVPPDLKARMRAIARELGTNVNELGNEAFEQWVERAEKKAQEHQGREGIGPANGQHA